MLLNQPFVKLMKRIVQIKLQKTAIDFSTCLYCRTFNFIIEYLANCIQFSVCILAFQQYIYRLLIITIRTNFHTEITVLFQKIPLYFHRKTVYGIRIIFFHIVCINQCADMQTSIEIDTRCLIIQVYLILAASCIDATNKNS